jgi:hypothetical protein
MQMLLNIMVEALHRIQPVNLFLVGHEELMLWSQPTTRHCVEADQAPGERVVALMRGDAVVRERAANAGKPEAAAQGHFRLIWYPPGQGTNNPSCLYWVGGQNALSRDASTRGAAPLVRSRWA